MNRDRRNLTTHHSVASHAALISSATLPASAALSTPTSSVSQQILPNSQPQPQACRSIPFHMLHPKAAEVLQRVDAQSAVDVESYVRALGDKKYAVVKETRKAALLNKAKEEFGSTELDETTVRKQTNLASAEASRAKKEFILDELHTQLRRKSDDAEVLGGELKRLLAMVEELGTANHRLDLQLRQERVANESFATCRTQFQPMGEPVPYPDDKDISVMSSQKPEPSTPPPHLQEQMYEIGVGVSETAPSDSFCMAESGSLPRCTTDSYGRTPCSTRNLTFEDDANKIGSLLGGETMDMSLDMEPGKTFALASSMPVASEITGTEALYESNPSDQFTLAG